VWAACPGRVDISLEPLRYLLPSPTQMGSQDQGQSQGKTWATLEDWLCPHVSPMELGVGALLLCHLARSPARWPHMVLYPTGSHSDQRPGQSTHRTGLGIRSCNALATPVG
jgi:hypothetical protein